MDAVELLTILERTKLDHLARSAQYQRNGNRDAADRHDYAFTLLDKVTNEFASRNPQAAELVDAVNTLVIRECGHELFEGTSKRDTQRTIDIVTALRETLNEGVLG